MEETDKAEFDSFDQRNRPLGRISLDGYGYPGREIFLRFSKRAYSTWQAEIFDRNPSSDKHVKPLHIFLPITFSENGKTDSKYCGEVRLSELAPTNFGDNLLLCFDKLTQGDSFSSVSVESMNVKDCPCVEIAKTVDGIPTKYYSTEEGKAAMLTKVIPAEDLE